jgi:hypothetical protein
VRHHAASEAPPPLNLPLPSPMRSCPFAWILVPVGYAAPDAGLSLPLALVRDVALPGGATRLDYQAIGSSGRRPYISLISEWPRCGR